jgi:hypothetical protein
MNNIKLDKNTLIMLGNTVSEILSKANVKEESMLHIKVDKHSFQKIDEDLFYRNEDTNKEFQPSENEILLKFNNLLIFIDKMN